MKKKKTPARRATSRKRTAGERCSASPGSAPFIPFVNNKGKVMYISGALTLGDLTRMGARVSLVPHGTPLADGEFKDVSTERSEVMKAIHQDANSQREQMIVTTIEEEIQA